MRTVRALRNTWGVREYILASVKRDFVSRYLGTQLGWFWVIAQPVAMILIYAIVFAGIMKPALPGSDQPFAYIIYLCAGMILWQLFAELLNRSINIFVGNADLLKKVNLPKFALPAMVTLSAILNFLVVFAVFVGFLTTIGRAPGLEIFAIVPAILIVVAFAAGLGILLGTINVFYRDVAQTAGLLLNFWFWLTPIVYPSRSLPEWLAALLEWNPMWPPVRFAQTLFLDRVVGNWDSLIYPAVVAVALCVLALHVFRQLGGEMVDEL